MSFFDKKEEVLEVELTQYGKHLLSKGEFVPVYYSFFDDDITYDWQYTGDSAELQNYAQDRIIDETPNNKIQYVFSGRETAVHEINELIRNNRTGLRAKKIQQTPEKHYALSAPLGKSSISSLYSPSWAVAALRGSFASNFRYQRGAQPTLLIPQINMNDVVCKSVVKQESLPDAESMTGDQTYQAGEYGAVGSSGELQLASQQYQDGTYIHVASDHIVLEIDEDNTDCLKENFDIEVFLIEKVDMSGKVTTPGLSVDEQNKVEKLIPLKFGKRFTNVVNGILIDDDAPAPIYNYDPTFVEHYLDIRVDKEIDKVVLCDIGVKPDSRKCGGMTADFLDCDDATTASSSGTTGAGATGTTEVYGSDSSSGPYGDDC